MVCSSDPDYIYMCKCVYSFVRLFESLMGMERTVVECNVTKYDITTEI